VLTLFRTRNFSLLWVAGTISVFGDWILFVALPFFVYQLTHSDLLTGTMFIAQVLPRILFGSLAGVFVDRWNRKWIMVLADLLRFGLLLLLLLIHTAHDIWLVYVVAAIESTIAQFFSPAKSASLPLLVSQDELVHANALNSFSENLARIVGPALGGIFLNLIGMASSAVIDSISFLLSALLLAFISIPTSHTSNSVEPEKYKSAHRQKLLYEWGEGLAIVGKNRLLKNIFIIVGAVFLAEGLITVLLVPFVTIALHGNSTDLGWLMSGQGIGGLLGSLLLGSINKGISKLRLIAWTLLAGGLLRLLIVFFPNLIIDVGLIVLVGIVSLISYVYISVVLQSAVPNAYLGRIFGLYGTLQGLTMLVGLLLASFLGDRLGVLPVLEFATILYSLVGLLALFILPPVLLQESSHM
jgi:MFS family permease